MMKRNFLYLVLIAACLAVFYGYQMVTGLAEDSAAPEITVSSTVTELSVQDPESALLRGITASDRRDGDVTASLVVERVRLVDSDGNLTVSCAAFDAAGNVAKAEFQARYTDYVSPRFSLSAPLCAAQGTGFDPLNILSAEDVLDGTVTHRIRSAYLDSNSGTLGEHDVQFRVTNSLGDTVELVMPMEIYLAGTYDAKLTLTDYLVYLPKGAVFDARNYVDTFTYGALKTSLKNGIPELYSLKTTGAVDTGTPGVYGVSVRVTYTPAVSNPVPHTGHSRLIVVVEG